MSQHGELYAVLEALLQVPGVSGNEQNVATRIAELLGQRGLSPGQLQSDSLGNHWLQLGPPGEPVRLLVAHMDEIGFRVTSIRPDGFCRVAPLGGIDAQLWEGTLVHVHTQHGAVPGCIAPVSLHVTTRQGHGPDKRLTASDLLLDLGARSAADVAALGVQLLDSITWPKVVTRLAGDLVQARSLDDRFGCTALVELAVALLQTPPAEPTVLAWAVQEELGLRGARAFARRFPACREVIAVDSYTIGGSPRDNTQFDGPRLGGGAAFRCWDATTMLPDLQRRAVLQRLEQLGHSVQFGHMPGGNDASVFEDSGARILAFGVPLMYSHSAVERIHLGDLAALISLLTDWCRTEV
ncbi:M28 family peptidase [bacterium]|nr:M28 family peptidase [bacterium]